MRMLSVINTCSSSWTPPPRTSSIQINGSTAKTMPGTRTRGLALPAVSRRYSESTGWLTTQSGPNDFQRQRALKPARRHPGSCRAEPPELSRASLVWMTRLWPSLGHRLAGAAPPQGDVELMTEQQILGRKSTVRLAQICDEYSDRVQEGKHLSHEAMILPNEANPGPDGIFGTGTGLSVIYSATSKPAFFCQPTPH